MKLRNTIILLILFFGLLGYYLFYEKKQPTREEKEEKQKVIFELDPLKVEEIQLEYSDTLVKLIRNINLWEIEKPFKCAGDQEQINSLISNSDTLKAERILGPDSNLAKYGLVNPYLKFSLRLSGEGGYNTILIGDKNPTRQFRFAKLADGDIIFLINSSIAENQLKKSLFDLRNKKLVSIEESEIKTVKVEQYNKQNFFAIERNQKGQFELINPFKLELDNSKTQSFVSNISNIQVKEFIVSNPSSFQPYGLHKPDIVVRLFSSKEPVDTVTLFFGKIDDEKNGVYAKVEDDTNVVLLYKTAFDNVSKSIDDLRIRKIFNFIRDNIFSITVEKGEKSYYFEVDTLGNWSIKPEAEFQEWKIKDIANEIPGLEIKRFVKEDTLSLETYGLLKPKVKMNVTLKDNTTYKMFIGNDAGPMHLAAAAGVPVIEISCHPKDGSLSHPNFILEQLICQELLLLVKILLNRSIH